MATGDDAAADGMDLVPNTDKVADGAKEINKTRDYIAQKTAPIKAATASSSGAANTLVKRDSAGKFGVPTPTAPTNPANKDYVDGLLNAATADATPDTLMRRASGGRVNVGEPVNPSNATTKSYVDDMFFDVTVNTLQANGSVGVDGNLQASAAVDFPAVYGNALGGSWRNLYIRSTGELGWVSSSRRSKKNIKNWSPDRQAILAMQLVQFQYKVAVDPEGLVQHGLIAEQLDELGLDWLVDYGEDGTTPEGVRYDLISLALLSVVQDHEDRLSKLEARE